MTFGRMPIEKESPEEFGYGNIAGNLSESSVSDQMLGDFDIRLENLPLAYVEHRGDVGAARADSYTRIGYGYPEEAAIREGLLIERGEAAARR